MTTIHASCVVFDGHGILIRGESGAGKSRFAHLILLRAPLYGRTAMLVGDDRLHVEARDGELLASAPDALKGLLEVRGLGLIRLPHAAEARLDLAIDLVPVEEVPRMPAPEQAQTFLHGVTLPRAFAASPERGLDILLTMFGEAEAVLDPNTALASVRFDGKTRRP